MIQTFIEAWHKNKHQLRLWLENDVDVRNGEFRYVDIVKAVFERVINPGAVYTYDTRSIHIIDDGNYQGTQIYLIPLDTYQPTASEYVVTYNWYGSCSGCDTLLRLQCHDKETCIEGIMTLALHMVERMKPLYEETEVYG